MTPLEVIGHEGVRGRLRRALEAGRLAHALLFAGPEGVGKARTARWLVASAFCHAAEAPCGKCPECRAVARGTHPDLRWLEPPADGRDIGIDAVRELRRFVSLAPGSSGRRAAVIDDADRLTVAAQNALLKTLEEPPSRSLLVLVTARPESLLATIRSRCQRVGFAPLPRDQFERVAATLLPDDRLEAARTLIGVTEGGPGRLIRILEAASPDAIKKLAEAAERAGRSGRYRDVLVLADALGNKETEMAARLEWLVGCYREALTAPGLGADEVDRLLDAAGALERAVRILRRWNPNRPLLAQATAMHLR